MANDSTLPADADLQRLQEQFGRLVDMPPSARGAWLEAHVADERDRVALLRLLAADSGDGFLDTPAIEHSQRLAPEEIARPESLIGQQIGEFRIVRQLGQGGMAAVFLGERSGKDFRQRAAIKLLRRGLYSEMEQRLFLRERQLLAGLDHPNIARLIDGGLTMAGIPYLAMEFVDGVPITQYARMHRLDLRERLELLLTVCRAVAAAHRSLIVHRDIKPSNILVSHEGSVKLLDFGIAKLIEADNEVASATIGVFTPEYAAPEQRDGQPVTTATDVYGLGLLLHELLIGTRPDKSAMRRPSSLVDIHRRADDNGDPPAIDPVRLRRQLRGDLDNILLKALASEPARRYVTASAFAEDIERYLRRQPVSAHPPSRWYRTGKFLQRHRAGVAISAALLLIILTALGIAIWQAEVARSEATRANTVRDFVVGLFDAARAHLPREQRPTPELLAAQAEKRLTASGNMDATTRSDLLSTLGQVELSLSQFSRAESLLSRAEKLQMEDGNIIGARDSRVLRAEALQRSGKPAEAAHMIDGQLEGMRTRPSPTLVRALSTLASSEVQLGKAAAAIAHAREAVTVADRIYGEDNTEAIATGFELGDILGDLQRYPESVAVLTPLLQRWRAIHGPEDDRYVAALESLATATDGIGNQPATERRYRELLTLKQRIYTAPSDAIARTLRDLGEIVARSERYGEAASLVERALAMQHAVYGRDHKQIAYSYDALGYIYAQQRDFAKADANYRAAIDTCNRLNLHDETCSRAHNNLGVSLYRQSKLDEAKKQMTIALDERRRQFGDNHPSVAYSLSTLSNIAVKQKQPDEAVRLSGKALDILERAGRGASRADALIRNSYAQALWLAGRNDDALREIDRAIRDWQRLSPHGDARRVTMLFLKAEILRDLKRTDEARSTARQAMGLGVAENKLSPGTVKLLHQLAAARKHNTSAQLHKNHR